MAKRPVVFIGVGEIGSAFARGLVLADRLGIDLTTLRVIGAVQTPLGDA